LAVRLPAISIVSAMSRILTLTAVLCMVVTSSALARPVEVSGHAAAGDGGGVNWVILGVAVAALAAAAALVVTARRYARF
jgi:hypothetical protein